MKKIAWIFTLFITTINAQVGVGTAIPNGALDVNSSLPTPSTHKAGLVPPIVALSATNSNATTTAGSNVVNPNGGGVPATGTIIYNTNTSAAGVNQVTPGYYFYNGSSWERLTSGATTNWSLTGNSGTTAGTNYIGTTDGRDIRIKTNDTDRWNISNANNGQLQSYSLGTAALPIYSFQNDTNTGIWSSGADALNFSTNGTEKMRIDSNGRVGIGTTSLTSKVKIDASSNAFPSLEIVPRATAPTGTASGQMAIINNSLFIYDSSRSKWLSSETMTYAFGRNGSADGQYLRYADVANANSGAKILKNATIVGITAESSGGNSTKAIDIDLATGTTTFNLASFVYSDTTTNINVDANDFISVYAQSAGASVDDLTVTLHLKWRE